MTGCPRAQATQTLAIAMSKAMFGPSSDGSAGQVPLAITPPSSPITISELRRMAFGVPVVPLVVRTKAVSHPRRSPGPLRARRRAPGNPVRRRR